MKFAIVNPRERTVDIVSVESSHEAVMLAGLPTDQTDHGTVYMGLNYICHQHAMFTPGQFYFAFGRVLVGGNAVLYASDSLGRTVDYSLPPRLWGGTFIGDQGAVEAAIRADKIKRPRLAIAPDDVFWQWPDPMPDMKAWHKKVAALNGPILIDDVLIIPEDKA